MAAISPTLIRSITSSILVSMFVKYIYFGSLPKEIARRVWFNSNLLYGEEMISTVNKEHLVNFAKNGFEFFPLIKPSGGRKLGTPKGWTVLGTDDLATINSWLDSDKFGFGMSFGSKRYFAFDLDGEEGVTYFKNMMTKLDIPSPTIVFKTPSGGRHLIYKYPEGVSLKNIAGLCLETGKVNKGTKCDVRAEGGFLGSFGARENGYELLTGDPSKPLTELPKSIVDILPKKTISTLSASALSMTKDLAEALGETDDNTPLLGRIPDIIGDGRRDNTLFNLIASWTRSGIGVDNIRILATEAIRRCEGDTSDIDINSMIDRTINNPDFLFSKRSLALQSMLKDLVFLYRCNKFMCLSDRVIMSKSSAESRYANVVQEVELKNGNIKLMPVFELWLKDTARLTFADKGYNPGGGDTYFDDIVQATLVNTYKKPKIKAIKNDLLWQKFKDFTKVVVGGDEAKAKYMIEFVAFLIQHPGRKIGVAPVLISTKHGVGKNFWLKIISGVLGEQNVSSLHSDNIVSNFNSAMADYQLVVINESVGEDSTNKLVKSKNAQSMSRIKSMITEVNQPIERKGVDIINQKVFTNFMFFSNDHNAISMSANDRRFRCIINDQPAKAREYFDSMDVLKTIEGAAAIKYGLENIELEVVKENMIHLEKSSDDLKVIIESMTPLEQDIYSDIEEKRSIFRSDIISRELFRMYLCSIQGDYVTINMADRLARQFFIPLNPNINSKPHNCVVIAVDMPTYTINRDNIRGGRDVQHYLLQKKPGADSLAKTGDDYSRGQLIMCIEKAIQGYTEDNNIKPLMSMVK